MMEYNFTNNIFVKKNAFTLAEVLITLGIIGVVAALTIPTLKSVIQKNILKAQIKKSFSMYKQIYNELKYDYTIMASSDNQFSWGPYNNAILSRLKIVKHCQGNAIEKGCIPEEYASLQVSGGCPGFSPDALINRAGIYTLSDGSFIIPYYMTWFSLWMIDVNGLKGPNKPGYDIFSIWLSKSNGLDYGTGCFVKTDNDMLEEVINIKDIEKW